MELDNVLKKLRKLQKLYEGAKKINSEGEAANAAAAIQRLLAKYNLTMAEVGEDKEERKDEVNHEKLSGYTYKSIGGDWEYRLWYVVCKYNFCKCFMYGSSYKSLIIFGSKENMEVVKWMWNMLAERFVEFSKDRFKEYQKTDEYQRAFTKPSKDRFQRGYLHAAVAGLDDKLRSIQAQDKVKEPEFGDKVTALAIRTNNAIDEYVGKMFGGYGKGRNMGSSARAGVGAARRAGYKDGYNTDVHKPISQSQHRATSDVKFLK